MHLPAKALAFWGDCATRDDFGPLGDLSAVPVYGGNQQNQSLCIVLKQEGTESCLRVAPRAVTLSPQKSTAPGFFYGLRSNVLPSCTGSP